MQDYHQHRTTQDRLRQQKDEQKKRKQWLRTRLPLDDEQAAWLQEQIHKIKERERAEQGE